MLVRDLAPALDELEIDFPPTYSYALGRQRWNSAYDGRCCPSWCDRVLLDAVGMRLMRAAADVAYDAARRLAPPQEEEEEEESRSDHLMVHLVFTLAASVAPGSPELGVRVKANVQAPVPIKVQYVAVGAG